MSRRCEYVLAQLVAYSRLYNKSKQVSLELNQCWWVRESGKISSLSRHSRAFCCQQVPKQLITDQYRNRAR